MATNRIVAARHIGHAECAACGMVVNEQPSPRVQVLHRDGKRVFFCSVGDSLHYLKDRNSHGKAAAVFVEVLPAGTNPKVTSTIELPWVAVEEAFFVVGIKRSGVMGEPVLAFRFKEQAMVNAREHQGRAISWTGLRDRLKPIR